MTRKTVVVSVLIAALVLAACGSDKKGSTTASTSKHGKKGLAVTTLSPTETIVTALVTAYNKAHPHLPQLRVVVESGGALTKAVKTSSPQIAVDGNVLKAAVKGAHKGTLGRNLAVIAVSTANPHHVSGLTAFAATSGLHTQVCGSKTSIGNFTALVLAKAKVKPNPATLAFDCNAKALADVASGKLDAALMFRAGTKMPSGIKLVAIPDAQNILVPVSYAAIGTAPGMAAFEKFLATKVAHAVLTRGGYLP
jgi:hypothetical protein